MAPQSNADNTGSAGETPGQEKQEEQQQTTDETSGNGEQKPSDTSTEPLRLPEDHPLVKTLATQKANLATQKSEITELRSKSAQVTKLETELNARPTKEAVETLQTRYDRLEAFLSAAGGPISKALDSRTFTRDLFESDKDVEDLAKAWKLANPSATSAALSSAGGAPGAPKPDINAALRAAAGK